MADNKQFPQNPSGTGAFIVGNGDGGLVDQWVGAFAFGAGNEDFRRRLNGFNIFQQFVAATPELAEA